MADDSDTRALMARLDRPPFSDVLDFCGAEDRLGHDDIPERRVWTHWGTTPDQTQIEECLEGMVDRASTIFHVGVGNSSLAGRFARRVSAIHGITIAHEEKELAETLGLPNYTVSVTNKYSREMEDVRDRYDLVIDNNPASFACCLFHFCRMTANYLEILGDGGAILTAEAGLDWVAPEADPAWSLNWKDWRCLGEALSMPARQITPTVYSLVRPPR
jgi:hypothetical protein